MKWNEQTFYIHPLTNKNSSCAVTHHITTRANQKIKQWSQRYDLCFYIYIYLVVLPREQLSKTIRPTHLFAVVPAVAVVAVAVVGGGAAAVYPTDLRSLSNTSEIKNQKTSRPMKVHHIFDYFLGESYFIYFTNSWRLNFQKQKRIPKHNVMPTHVMNKKYRTWLPPQATAEPTQDASTRILIFLGDQKPQPQPTPFPTGRRVATTNLAGRWPIVPGFRTRKMLQAGHRVGRPGGRDVTNHWLWWGNEPSEGMMCALYGRGSYDSFMNQLHTPRSLFAETKEGGFKCRFWRFRKIQIQTPPKKSLQKPMVTGQKWKPQRVQKHCYARKTRLGQPICQMRFVYCHLTSSPKWGWR